MLNFEGTLKVANANSIGNRLHRIFIKNKVYADNFLDNLISDRYTWHYGGMSDPFQPINEKLKVTNDIIDICNKYGVTILFSTKSDTVHGANVRPDLHSFQLSVSNVYDRKDIEPNVPSIDKRYRFYSELKKEGFKVGIRIQPFIPGVSDIEIVKMFDDADHFTIEGLKVIPQDGEQKDFCFGYLNENPRLYTNLGLLNMIPEKRMELYEPLVEYLKEHDMSYSVSDNDLRRMGNNNCCCGDKLVRKATRFNTTSMIMNYNRWRADDVLHECGKLRNCVAKNLFASNRQEGCVTVEDFIKIRFSRPSSPISPKFQYIPELSLF